MRRELKTHTRESLSSSITLALLTNDDFFLYNNIFISKIHVWFAWKHHSVLKKGIDRNDKTRQDSIVWKTAWHFTREEVTSKDEICSGWRGRIFASLLRVGKIIYGLWFKPWPFEFCGQLDIEYLCFCPKLGKLVFSLWGLSSKSSLYHTSLARAYNHDTIWVKELSSWKHPPPSPPKKQ